ncbi:hypothetical protein [uncultured Lawsonella sp.]|uniref:hypothetical protein n=1 Tax=uncultured Lawsonella sp. TaxID=1847727 RepID=UPI0025E82FEB|nr:hypothetical protein [uncultured Lawsonella sp.]
MGKLAIPLACLIWGICGWKAHSWTVDQTLQRTRWEEQLTTLHEARTALAAGGTTTAHETLRTIPPECVPHLLLCLLIRQGTPLDGTLAAAEETLRTSLHADSQRRNALAGVRATVLIMVALPIFGILLGIVLGVHPLRFFAHGGGSLALLAGVGLQTAGLWWIRHMVDGLPSPLDTSVSQLPLLAALLRAGMHVDDARAQLPPTPACCANLLQLSARQGAPIADQLEALARDRQRQALATCEEAAQEMGVLLARPLGVCFLPAFILLGVLPTVLELGGAFFHIV